MENVNRKPESSLFAHTIIHTLPRSSATVRGDPQHSRLFGTVNFYLVDGGTLVTAEVYGLPTNSGNNIFAMHIHEGNYCTGNRNDPFANTGGHYNPTNMRHPLHVGDLLPLFGNNGFAYYSFFTNRFRPDQVVGRTVIIHNDPDDFRTQPSGNSGKKIACGVIYRT